MAQGVKFDLEALHSVEEITAIAVKFNGNVRAISEHLGVQNQTMYRYFKDNPKGKEIIDFVRGYNTETDLDLAEHVNRYNLMNYKTNPTLAQRAAENTLEKKGHSRGWIKKEEAQVSQTTVGNFKDLIKQMESFHSESSIDEINKSAETKSE